MIATGLLWYDDDTRRPLALKIAEAAERYRERVGYEPTTCELSPTQTPAALAATQPPSPRARKAAALPRVTLHVEPNDHLKPNYFLVGVAVGEKPRPVRGWIGSVSDERERAPAQRTSRRKLTPPTSTSQPPAVSVSRPVRATPAPRAASVAEQSVASTRKRASASAAPVAREVMTLPKAKPRRDTPAHTSAKPPAATPPPAPRRKQRASQASTEPRSAPTAAKPSGKKRTAAAGATRPAKSAAVTATGPARTTKAAPRHPTAAAAAAPLNPPRPPAQARGRRAASSRTTPRGTAAPATGRAAPIADTPPATPALPRHTTGHPPAAAPAQPRARAVSAAKSRASRSERSTVQADLWGTAASSAPSAPLSRRRRSA
jgi:hypothetical protein